MRVFPEPVGPRNKKLPIGRPGGVHSRQVHLIDVDDLLDGFILAYNQFEQGFLQRFGVFTRSASGLDIFLRRLISVFVDPSFYSFVPSGHLRWFSDAIHRPISPKPHQASFVLFVPRVFPISSSWGGKVSLQFD